MISIFAIYLFIVIRNLPILNAFTNNWPQHAFFIKIWSVALKAGNQNPLLRLL